MKGKLNSADKFYTSWPMAVFYSTSAPKIKASAFQTLHKCLYSSLQSCLAKETGSWHPLLAYQ